MLALPDLEYRVADRLRPGDLVRQAAKRARLHRYSHAGNPRGMQERETSLGAVSAWNGFVRDPATHAVIALGITQIIAWGTTLYALGVLGKPIAADTGWSQGVVFGGLTVGLLVSSAVSTTVGRLIDTRGGRQVMSVGSILTAAGLVVLSQVTEPYAYWAAWALIGLAMRMNLYDAAFAALVQVAASRGRRAGP